MTKSIIVFFMSAYSLTRLICIAYGFYANTVVLPYWVMIVAGVVSLALLTSGIMYIFGKLRTQILRVLILFNALAAVVNMVGLILFPVNHITMTDLIITGTFFDVLFFCGTMTIPIRSTVGKQASRRRTDPNRPRRPRPTELEAPEPEAAAVEPETAAEAAEAAEPVG